ncbi:MAG: S8 family serine peptidase [bacterium]
MPVNFEHLKFHKTIKNRAKIQGGGNSSEISKQNKTNRFQHSNKLKSELNTLLNQHKSFSDERQAMGFAALPLEVPLLLKVDEETYPIDELYKYGLEVVSEEENGYIIVATDEQGLEKFQNLLEIFKQTTAKGESIRGSGKIAEIHEINTEDLPQKRLSEYLFNLWPFDDNTIFVFDISIECKGLEPFSVSDKRKSETDEAYCERSQTEKLNKYAEWDNFIDAREDKFNNFLEPYVGQYEILVQRNMDNYCFGEPPEYFDIRIKTNGKVLKDLTLNFPYIFEISEPDNFICEIPKQQISQTELEFNILAPDHNAPAICIMDSGVQEGHKYLAPSILNNESKSFIDEESVFDEYNPNGHGTRVTGKVLYPDGFNITSDYKLPCWICNARILDRNCYIPENKHPAELAKEVVNTFKDKVKIYNQSVNSLAPCRTKHMSSWASEIDLLSYKYDILFIQSAGNIHKETSTVMPYSGIKNYLNSNKNYPDYLYEEKSSRISNPAQSMFALTIGSLANGEFLDEITGECSLEKMHQPSSFSRTGFGLWGSIKPDVVEYGGGYVKSNDNNLTIKEDTSVELLRTSPPGPAFAKDDIGTSYSTPKVSYVASEIQKLFPDQPALLYRALIGHSAEWTEWTKDLLANEKLKVLRSIGYGVPNLKNALQNNEYKITFITDQKVEINVKEAHMYYIPIPDSLRTRIEEIDVKVTVTLAYTAKPRRTRMHKKGYLSSWLEWDSCKPSEPIENFQNRIFADGSGHEKYDNEPWQFATKPNDGIIRGISRNESTLQKDWRIIQSNELPEKFAIAVKSHQGWDKDPFSKSYYSLIVSFEAINSDLPIYESIKTEVQSEIELETEAESEIQL